MKHVRSMKIKHGDEMKNGYSPIIICSKGFKVENMSHVYLTVFCGGDQSATIAHHYGRNATLLAIGKMRSAVGIECS
ncbi:hypothetical protein Leryth_021123 [Lithospermum erythrorhizon]|nr:hypothetical protein Leryth_021123 [Lithospermum erythrorhizon]